MSLTNSSFCFISVIDNFAKPKLQRRTPLYLDHLHVIFYPTIEEFDERLLSSLREHLAGVKSDMKLDCTIVERRLKVQKLVKR